MEMETVTSSGGMSEDLGSTEFPPTNVSNWENIPIFPEEWSNKQVALIIILGSITLVTILANSFVLYIFAVGKRRLRNPTNLLLANLAVADLLVGLVIMPFLSATTILDGKWIFGDLACQSFDYIHFLLCGASMWSMIGVGVDRYIGVSRPLQYKHIITKKKTILLIIFIWMAAASLTSGPLTVWQKPMSGIPIICWINLEKYFLFFVISFAYWIPVTGTIIIYYVVYRNAVAPFMNRAATTKQKSDEAKGAKSKQTRLAKSIAIVTGTLFLFYAPVFLTFAMKAFDSPYFSIDYLFLTGWIRYCCSTVNPFIYGLAVPGYKQEIKERLFGVHKRGRLEDSMTQSYVTGSDQGNQVNSKGQGKMEPPQIQVMEGTPTPGRPVGSNLNRYCTQCGFLMKNFLPTRNARCDKCHVQVMCGSWMLPGTWGQPSYFLCPNCPTIRFFDGVQSCFCQNCNHKFEPSTTQPPHEKLASLTTVHAKPPQQIMQNQTTSNSGAPRTDEMKVGLAVDQTAKVKAIARLRNSVILPYLEHRQSQLLLHPGAAAAAGGTGMANNTNSINMLELEEIVAQLQQSFGLDLEEIK